MITTPIKIAQINQDTALYVALIIVAGWIVTAVIRRFK